MIGSKVSHFRLRVQVDLCSLVVIDQLVHEFTNSASKPKDLQHVIFARINKTRQSSSSPRAAHAGGCCSSSTGSSCCQTETADQQSCCSTQPSNGCCNASSSQPRGTCTRPIDTSQQPNQPNASSGIDTPLTHKDAAQTQLSALQTSQQPESLRSIAFPPGVAMRDCTIFYVGEEGRGLVNLMMEHAENRVRRPLVLLFASRMLTFFGVMIDISILTRRHLRAPAPRENSAPPLPPTLRPPLLVLRIDIRHPRPQRRSRPIPRARQTLAETIEG